MLNSTPPRTESLDYLFYPLGDDRQAVGDVMPYYDAASGAFYIYYLKDVWNDAAHQRHPWYGLKTTDFHTYARLSAGQMLGCGNQANDQDYALGTGSVIKRGSTYHAFYTGHNPNYPSARVSRREGILRAASPALNRPFAKQAGFATIYAPAGQGFDDHDNFRDPFVFYDAGAATYYLIVAARKNVNGAWRGVIVKYASSDLLQWTYRGLLYDGGPTNFFMMETPEIFKIGKTYYLLFSDIHSKNLYYRKSASPTGPWSSPAGADRFEGSGVYAAKTAANARGERYLFGWTNRFEGDADGGAWKWGGNLVVHRIYQKKNQDLAVAIPRTLKNYVEARSEPLEKKSQQGSVTRLAFNAHSYTLGGPADKRMGRVLFHPIHQTRYKLHAAVSYNGGAGAAAREFGFLLGASDGHEDFYRFRFAPGQGRFRLEKEERSPQTATTPAATDVPFPMKSGAEYTVDIVVENSLVVVYLNDVAALTARLYKVPGASWGIFAQNGTATFTKIVVTRP